MSFCFRFLLCDHFFIINLFLFLWYLFCIFVSPNLWYRSYILFSLTGRVGVTLSFVTNQTPAPSHNLTMPLCTKLLDEERKISETCDGNVEFGNINLRTRNVYVRAMIRRRSSYLYTADNFLILISQVCYQLVPILHWSQRLRMFSITTPNLTSLQPFLFKQKRHTFFIPSSRFLFKVHMLGNCKCLVFENFLSQTSNNFSSWNAF